MAPQWLSWQSG